MANHRETTNVAGNQNHQAAAAAVTVVMVPLPAQGHLNPLLHLAGLISSNYTNIPVHYVTTPAHVRQAKSRVQGWNPDSISNLHFHEFPVPSHETPPPQIPTTASYCRFPAQLVPGFFASVHLREPVFALMQKLSGITTKRLVVIHDVLMAYVIQDIASIQNSESYAFSATSAFFNYSSEWGHAGKPQGVPELQLLQLLPNLNFPRKFVEFVGLQFGTKITSSGTLINTSKAIDGPFQEYFSETYKTFGSDKIWAIGPLNPVLDSEKSSEKKSPRHNCLDWLDKQAPNSVIYVSFGSATTFSDEDIKEMAIGLEQSGQKFLWVVRDADSGCLSSEEGEDHKRIRSFSGGFERRMNEGNRGIIVRDWAPQLEILAHPSTGGYLSHCGWGSCLESLSHGVPIAVWPMHSDNHISSVLVTKVLKVGVPVHQELLSSDGQSREIHVTSKDIENGVRTLMNSTEGDEIRKRARELRNEVKASLMDNGTPLELDSFVTHILR